ncbi:hypothetical protein BDB00DRAFT_847247 [Zychaea mexicana]|uniref:uncharacterized protein n=1 Tax=Zychaea mexicana TaxID=64656 RepID=UPI0022FDD727|nr:uncharacterized protein BDB00DRAFT_847247 [Zychaea mexicana]KAI9488647.1 hypothetical protein BDB00DRAFT_847247 [Zychaea mexicana]
MTFSRMEAALEDAFVEWINTFDGKSGPIDTVVELSDGSILSSVLIDIDGKWFRQLGSNEAGGALTSKNKRNSDGSNNTATNGNSTWVVRFNTIKKMHKLITRYFDEVLGQDAELLPSINLAGIAKDADLHELLLMCQLIIAIAVQSDNNRTYIDMIQSLSQKSQHALMLSIEEVMNHFNNDMDSINPRNSQLSGTSGTTTSRSLQFDSSDMPYRYQVEFEKVIVEKKQAESSHNQLLAEYDELRERFVSHSCFQ